MLFKAGIRNDHTGAVEGGKSTYLRWLAACASERKDKSR